MQIINNLFKKFSNGKIGLSGLTDDLLAVYIKKTFMESKRDIILVANTLYEANKIYQLLVKDMDGILLFPMDDFLTSEAIAISPDLKISRLETINNLVDSHKKNIVVTHLMGYLRYLPEKLLWENNVVKLNKDLTIKKEELIKSLYNIGYSKETLVSRTGEFATRGYILDVFPINEQNPVRIEFWGDDIESIRFFNLDTQLSIEEVEKISISPFDEFLSHNNEVERREQKYLPQYSNVSKISDYLKDPIVMYYDYDQIYNGYLMLREEILNYNREHDNNAKTNYMYDFDSIHYDDEIYAMSTDNILPGVDLDYIDKYDSKSVPFYEGNSEWFNRDICTVLSKNKTVIICLNNREIINKCDSFIDGKYILTNEFDIKNNRINIIEKKMDSGYVFGDYVFFGQANLFKKQENKGIYKSRFKYGARIGGLAKLSVGDYVVHQAHGIGIYCGIETIEKNGVKKDYIQIKYKNNDKLYIPAEKISIIWKFSSNDSIKPPLNHLGGVEWQKTKLRIKARLYDIAGKLIKIAAEREVAKGFAFSVDSIEQIKFENDFSFVETKDQLISVKQVKLDMEKSSPMDRLLCGDVGYGKTEVAFRAAFKAIQDNKQVALLCPTTILSNQHYVNAIERFKNFAVNIALLNRFTTANEIKAITTGLEKGSIDFVIGTHRLLSKDIKFMDLGLLIVDEEQRFGVSHKEKIKEMKSNIDILTLSATPIPRTLQISMLGLRNLSLIETPPINRFPIQTYVMEYNEHIIKEAIYREISRGGQVFLLFNRIAEIEEKVNLINKLVPEAKVTYAHGQMAKQKIEDKMLKFIKGEFDVLVCTTIIEAGIDIPNVNTLIIIDADNFGLSQLYQIRGRVGRSNRIAYAYLTYSRGKVLNEIAAKRLNSIKEFTALGSGFSIAMRDLSIRGAGDILGSEQAGFIDSIGIELYLKMLKDEVEKIKGIKTASDDDSEIEEKPLLNIDTHISNAYVEEDELKIEIHQRINTINDLCSLNEVKTQIEDRFGKITEAMNIYMHEEWFEKIAKEKGIDKVNQLKDKIEFIFNKNMSNTINIKDLYALSCEVCNEFRVLYSERRIKLILNNGKLDKHWLYYAIELFSKM